MVVVVPCHASSGVFVGSGLRYLAYQPAVPSTVDNAIVLSVGGLLYYHSPAVHDMLSVYYMERAFLFRFCLSAGNNGNDIMAHTVVQNM